jgi:ATP-dependent exoDNAse (exonuclease V) alpha subunit
MMEMDRLKKKKLLFIEKNVSDKNSQDALLIKGIPVMAIRNNKTIGFVNGSTFLVKSIEPLVLKDTLSHQDITINKDVFKEYFYVNYCSTVHRCQGETITEPFTIHEWNRMDTKMRYTAISRATSKTLINILDETEKVENEIEDTDFGKVKVQQNRAIRMNDICTTKDSKQ